ncbi:hypothetical protein OEZ86_004188 [Tetradesmus obliquus]|nr:hypothetical protein OEZ86_004188 [Tetradesmus obliquus]
MALKKEAAALRAAGAAERRQQLAAEQQQRQQQQLAAKGQARQAAQQEQQQQQQQAVELADRQEAWGGLLAATLLTGRLAQELRQQQQRGAAARLIAACYKRCLLRRRQQQLVEKVLRLRRLLEPHVVGLRAAAHAAAACRLLGFLQAASSSSGMIGVAAQRLLRDVKYIQRFWRRIRLVRAAQEADGVIDLELEARVKGLTELLPRDIRLQVARQHLASARRQLLADREAHGAALLRYERRLALETRKAAALREAGVKGVSVELQPPKAPRLRVLLPRSQLKELLAAGLDLVQQQQLAAALAADDARGADIAAAVSRSSGGGGKRND